ncbi:MAG: ATP-binding protein [Deltaproteobacteria bacterium]|nr:ATP-binding protein [Deltaproteobacteria bacterium]MBI3293438.1 ATP-binding protein [Deltaproteobacteria bacterium]
MLHRRIAQERVRYLVSKFPTLTLLGARQIGKSTLARLSFPEFSYVDLEDPLDLARVQADLPYFLKQNSRVIIDEAQFLPELFPALRSHIDRNKRFKAILLGSANPVLYRKTAEALTGRTTFFELSGISVLEHKQESLWFKGAFPRLHWTSPKVPPAEWYFSYVRTYLAQDIPQLGFRISQIRLRKLLTMIAHSQGHLCNLSEFGASLGISHNSISHILDIFEGTFSVRRLMPYYLNMKKRMVKSPKLYIRDNGLLHYLMDMGFERRRIESHPKFGMSFESFCVEQIISSGQRIDPACEAYFFRTQAGLEVDLILKFRGKLIPVEIKVSPPSSVRSLELAMRDLKAKTGFVVTAESDRVAFSRGVTVLSLTEFLQGLKSGAALKVRPSL